MDGEAACRRRKELIGIELPKAQALVTQAIRNAEAGNYNAAQFSAAFKAVESIKNKVEATCHPERGFFCPGMCWIWRPLTDMSRVKDLRKSMRVLSFV
jgi:hypothetical protein